MPYADPERQREFQRDWLANRRREFLAGKSCEECGSRKNLRIRDGDGGKLPVHGGAVFSLSAARRQRLLANYRVLCRKCWDMSNLENQRTKPDNALDMEAARKIRRMAKTGQYTQLQLAKLFNCDRKTINDVLLAQRWVEPGDVPIHTRKLKQDDPGERVSEGQPGSVPHAELPCVVALGPQSFWAVWEVDGEQKHRRFRTKDGAQGYIDGLPTPGDLEDRLRDVTEQQVREALQPNGEEEDAKAALRAAVRGLRKPVSKLREEMAHSYAPAIEIPEAREERDEQLTYTVLQASKALGVEIAFFREHILSQLRSIEVAERTLIPATELRRWVEEQAK